MRLLSLVPVVVLAACGGSDEGSGSPDAAPTYRATWYQDVAPIVAKHCMSCHQDGGIGPFELTSYDSARDNSIRMMAQIDKGAMPPFDAREEADCTPRFSWVDDPRLSVAEKATLKAWIEDGHPLGTMAAIPPPPSQDLQNVSMTLAPTTGFVTAGMKDQFICFILDPNVTAPIAWLTGLQVKPDIDEVVHHAVITEVRADKKQPLIDAHGIGQPFDCETIATPADFVVNVWTPGNQPFQTQPEIAVPVEKGAVFVMQIHYHPAGVSHPPDKTAIDLQFSTQWPSKMYFVLAFGNESAAPNLLADPDDRSTPEFRIPRNMQAHAEHMRVTIPPAFAQLGEIRLFSANPHMHLVGTHISSTIERPAARGGDPKTECLANGAWNFDWQRTYIYNTSLDKLPSLAVGDVVDIKCTWDNTIENPFVQRMLNDSGLPPQPIDITLGEQTTNEMCLEIFGVALNAPAQPANLTEPIAMPDMSGFKVNVK